MKTQDVVSPEETQVIAQEQTQEITQVSDNTTTTETQENQDLYARYANMPTRSQVKQMAYAQAFQGKGGRFNTYYA